MRTPSCYPWFRSQRSIKGQTNFEQRQISKLTTIRGINSGESFIINEDPTFCNYYFLIISDYFFHHLFIHSININTFFFRKLIYIAFTFDLLDQTATFYRGRSTKHQGTLSQHLKITNSQIVTTPSRIPVTSMQ